jgi:FkbM family methyltransferase
MAGYDFSVHCFEPSKETFAQLTSAIGKDNRCLLSNVGLGKKEESLTLYSDSPTSGCASLTKPSFERAFRYEQNIKIVTMDDYCNKNKIEKVNWLKIDVEGHEIDVLRGSENMFKDKKIENVYFEFGFPAIESRVFIRDYFEFFRDHGMDMFRVTMAGSLVPLKKYRGSYEQFRASSSYFAKLKKG